MSMLLVAAAATLILPSPSPFPQDHDFMDGYCAGFGLAARISQKLAANFAATLQTDAAIPTDRVKAAQQMVARRAVYQITMPTPAAVQNPDGTVTSCTGDIAPHPGAISASSACAAWVPQRSTSDTNDDRGTRAAARVLINSGIPQMVDSGNAMLAGIHNSHVWAAEENAADRAAVCGQPAP